MKTFHVAAVAALLLGIGACGALAPAGESAAPSPWTGPGASSRAADELDDYFARVRAVSAGPWRLDAPPEIRHDIVGRFTSSFRATNTGDGPEVPLFVIRLRDDAGKVRARLSCAGPDSLTSRGVEPGRSSHVWCVSHGRARYGWTDVELESKGW